MQHEQKEFIIEKIKERPINKKKLMRRTLITAAMAVMFGLIACFTFLLLEPVISKWLYPEEPPQMVLFPEDPEEMSPEDMLSDTMQNMQNMQNKEEQTPPDPESITLDEGQIEDILSKVVLDKESYLELYGALSDFTGELEKSMVTVSGFISETEWMETYMESSRQTSGVIVANTEKELLMLVSYEPISDAEFLVVEFFNQLQVEAYIKQAHAGVGLAIVAVDLEGVSEQYTKDITVATLGSTNSLWLRGQPVIALGSPTGSIETVAYGMIVGEDLHYMEDFQYKMLHTDIIGSSKAGGFLFNLQGKLIGVITNVGKEDHVEYMISAYGISDLRKLIEKLSNQIPVPYLGVVGREISDKVNRELQVPLGIYVSEVAKNSPAMLAGIQQGDIIIKMNGYNMQKMARFSTELLQTEAGQTITVVLMRQSQEEYKEMTLSIVLDKAKGEE